MERNEAQLVIAEILKDLGIQSDVIATITNIPIEEVNNTDN